MGEDTQLHLRVVGGKKHAALRRDEPLADTATLFRCGSGCSASWDLTRRAAGRGDRLVKEVWIRPVSVDQPRQGVGVGPLEFGQRTVLEEQGGNG